MRSLPSLSTMMVLCAVGAGCAMNAPVASPRELAGVAPSETTEVLVIDTAGRAFRATPATDGAFVVAIDSTRPVTTFLVSADQVRVLRVAPAPDARATQSVLPAWEGQASTMKLSTCDCNEDGVDDDAEGEENLLAQIDSDQDGVSDFEDADDDDDGLADDDDDDVDGSGEDDRDEDLDRDDDGRPDYVDDDDDDDGIRDEDEEEDDDRDDDGIPDDDDDDDDNDGDADDDDDDDDDDEEETSDDEEVDGDEADDAEDTEDTEDTSEPQA